jgi:dinuclear metal center YbgI/SA1388 family protein
MVSCQTIIDIIEKLAPKRLALEWDNPGLMIGDFAKRIDKIMVTLTLEEQALDYAVKNRVDMVITHHPLFFKPVKSLRLDLPLGKLVRKVLQNDITVYSAHTNLDVAFDGVNDILANILELKSVRILKKTMEETYKKLVVFVPRNHAVSVRNAIGNAGGGFIGNYSHCTFSVQGEGSFKPHEGSSPFIGEVGKLETVDEVRIETIVHESLLKKVISAMLKAHPYEEVAYDIYPLSNEGKTYGMGRIGYLGSPMKLCNFCNVVKQKLKAKHIRVVGDLTKEISKVALCGGAGGDLISSAAFSGADVIVTGDVKYHDAIEAKAAGIAVIDAGHFYTENPIVYSLAALIKSKILSLGEKVVVTVYEGKDPFDVI